MPKFLVLLVIKVMLSLGHLFSQQVTLSSDANNNHTCSGTPVIFTATVNNAGKPFTYQWKKNAVVVSDRNTPTQSDTSLYVDITLNNGDEISCEVNSNGTVLKSNVIRVVVHPKADLGKDTALFVECDNDSVDLTTIYDFDGYSTNWSTSNPTAAPVGTYRLIATSAEGCSDTADMVVTQEVAFWQGTMNSDWHTAANWSTQEVPGPKTNVVVHRGASYPCVISASNGVAATLRVSEQGDLKLTEGRTIMLAGKCAFLPAIFNAYEGVYQVTGTMTDLFNPLLTGLFPLEYHLVARGVADVAGFDPVYFKDFFVPVLNGGVVSGYGAFSPVFTIDAATHKITKVVNYYGQPASNTRSAELDPSGENSYDPVTKAIRVKFFMKQFSVVPQPPNIRVMFDWTLTYLHPR